VLSVCSQLPDAGLMLAIITVRQLPPENESRSTCGDAPKPREPER
jgi:hypothetical protein